MRYYRNTLGIFFQMLVKKDLILKHYYIDNKNALENSCSTEE